jgi:hypothetical protein
VPTSIGGRVGSISGGIGREKVTRGNTRIGEAPQRSSGDRLKVQSLRPRSTQRSCIVPISSLKRTHTATFCRHEPWASTNPITQQTLLRDSIRLGEAWAMQRYAPWTQALRTLSRAGRAAGFFARPQSLPPQQAMNSPGLRFQCAQDAARTAAPIASAFFAGKFVRATVQDGALLLDGRLLHPLWLRQRCQVCHTFVSVFACLQTHTHTHTFYIFICFVRRRTRIFRAQCLR